MAKEAELKKIELKVSVNCCDGCKKKVKKLLRSIEGVLKTEIDPVQPKVTVLGSVDPQVLIKKLSKSGKQAEICSVSGANNNQNDQKDKKDKEKDVPVSKESNGNVKPGPDPGKCPEEKIKETIKVTTTEEQQKEKDSKKGQEKINQETLATPLKPAVPVDQSIPMIPEVKYAVYPSMVVGAVNDSMVRTTMDQANYHVAMPYYTVCSYIAPLPPQVGLSGEYGRQMVAQPMFESPVTQVGTISVMRTLLAAM